MSAFLAGYFSFSNAFTTVQRNREIVVTPLYLKASENANDALQLLPETSADNKHFNKNQSILSNLPHTRQAFLASMVTSTVGISTTLGVADAAAAPARR